MKVGGPSEPKAAPAPEAAPNDDPTGSIPVDDEGARPRTRRHRVGHVVPSPEPAAPTPLELPQAGGDTPDRSPEEPAEGEGGRRRRRRGRRRPAPGVPEPPTDAFGEAPPPSPFAPARPREPTTWAEPGDLDLTDPAQIRARLQTPLAYARHAMILAEHFRRETGADRDEAIGYLAKLFVAVGDPGFGRAAVKAFGPATGIVDLYPLEVVVRLLSDFPGFLPKTGHGRLFRRREIQAEAGEPVVLDTPPGLRIRGFALRGGGKPGYRFEPDLEPDRYRLVFESGGRFTLLIAGLTSAGYTVIDELVAEVRGERAEEPDRPPRDAERIATWPIPAIAPTAFEVGGEARPLTVGDLGARRRPAPDSGTWGLEAFEELAGMAIAPPEVESSEAREENFLQRGRRAPEEFSESSEAREENFLQRGRRAPEEFSESSEAREENFLQRARRAPEEFSESSEAREENFLQRARRAPEEFSESSEAREENFLQRGRRAPEELSESSEAREENFLQRAPEESPAPAPFDAPEATAGPPEPSRAPIPLEAEAALEPGPLEPSPLEPAVAAERPEEAPTPERRAPRGTSRSRGTSRARRPPSPARPLDDRPPSPAPDADRGAIVSAELEPDDRPPSPARPPDDRPPPPAPGADRGAIVSAEFELDEGPPTEAQPSPFEPAPVDPPAGAAPPPEAPPPERAPAPAAAVEAHTERIAVRAPPPPLAVVPSDAMPETHPRTATVAPPRAVEVEHETAPLVRALPSRPAGFRDVAPSDRTHRISTSDVHVEEDETMAELEDP